MDSYYKLRQLFYYKVRHGLLQIATGITKCDTVYYKLRQVLQSAMDLLQIATGITKCDDYYKLRQNTHCLVIATDLRVPPFLVAYGVDSLSFNGLVLPRNVASYFMLFVFGTV